MIKNWSIRRETGKWRRYRYSLMLGAEFNDMIGVLGRIANVCGRPRKEGGVAVYSLSIQSNDTQTLDLVKTILSAMAMPGTQTDQGFVPVEELPEAITAGGAFVPEEHFVEPQSEAQPVVFEVLEQPAEPVVEEAVPVQEAEVSEPLAEETAQPLPDLHLRRSAAPKPRPMPKPAPVPQPEPEPVPEPEAEAVPQEQPVAEEVLAAETEKVEQAEQPVSVKHEKTLRTQEASVPAAAGDKPPDTASSSVPDYLENELNKLEARLEPKSIAHAAVQQNESESVLRARIEAEIKAKIAAEESARRLAEESIRKEAEMKARIEAEMRAKMEAEMRAKFEAEAKAKTEIDSAAQKEAEAKARLEAEIRARIEAEMLAKHPAPAAAVQAAAPAAVPAPAPVAPPPAPEPAAEEPEAVTSKGPLILEYGAAGPRKPSWSIEIPLVPTYNFETLVVGANRFAHAAGMSVIESPGTMYNPLMLHGPSCCGKSHFLHAIAYGMSKDMGQQNVFVTDGVRLSRGVLRLGKEGKLDTLDKTLADIKALFIDDIHLMSVNDENKQFLSRWLNQFVAKKKQIVLTSLYPPKNLARLEAALGFQFSQGWIVELKPSVSGQLKNIVQSMVVRSGMELQEEEINRYLVGPNLSLSQISEVLDKLRVMSNVVPRSGPANYGEMLAAILGTSEEEGSMLPTEDDIRTSASYVRPPGASWGGWGFFYPRGMQQYVPWMISQIYEKMKELGVGGGFDSSVQLEYDPADLMLSSFRITDACSDKGLRGAVVLLPPNELAPEAARRDFTHTLEHLTATLFIRCATIETGALAKSSSYMGAVLNMVA